MTTNIFSFDECERKIPEIPILGVIIPFFQEINKVARVVIEKKKYN